MIDREENKAPLPIWFKRLSLKSFRNYKNIELELCRGLNLVVGPNGHGKTNLVEAIYFLCLGRSFREKTDRRLIMFEMPHTRLFGEVESNSGCSTVEVFFNRNGQKRAQVDGIPLRLISEVIGRIPIVSLTPEDGTLVLGDPGSRRRFLDVVLAQTDKKYLTALKEYRKAIRQRNRCLREGRDLLAEAYDDSIVQHAVVIRRQRNELVDFIHNYCGRTYGEITNANEQFQIIYRPSPPFGENDTDVVSRALSDAREADRERGFTGVGPHRDDIRMKVDERDLRTYGSHGQARTALATLKLAEVSYYSLIYNRPPVLIMDEVAAVFDSSRASNLVKLLSEMASQVFVTSPLIEGPGGIRDFADCVVEVSNGNVRRQR